MQQLLLQPEKTPKNLLKFDNLGSFVSYLEYLTDTHFSENAIADFDSPLLKKAHFGNSILLVEKYAKCSIPDLQLEFIFESMGIQNYNAALEPGATFKHSICTHEGVTSEIFSPNITGEHFNPYIRFQSSSSSAVRSCSKFMDLAGLEITDLSVSTHDNIFLDLVLTFPSIVDFYMYNPDCRVRAAAKIYNGSKHKSRLNISQINFIDRMNKCRSEFFNCLHSFFDVPSNNILGMSSSLHVWSSEFPVLPNCHIHAVIPFFSYSKKSVLPSNFLESFLMDFNHYVPSNDPNGSLSIFSFSDIVAFVENGSKKVKHSRQIGSIGCKTSYIDEVKLVERFILDPDLYKRFRLHLSRVLADRFNFIPFSWSSAQYPVDIDKLKDLWSDIVYNEFQDIMDYRELLDVHVSWIPHYSKSKLLHKLQYKTRPAVLDLDLFFKKHSNIVVNYNKVNSNKILDLLYYNLEIALRCSDNAAINRYESLIKKAEQILGSHSDKDVFSWLQFLSTWVTDTRVYGFLRNIKRYMLDPDHKILVEQQICSICNGSITTTGIKTNFCIVDYVILRSRSKFLIYNLKGDI